MWRLSTLGAPGGGGRGAAPRRTPSACKGGDTRVHAGRRGSIKALSACAGGLPCRSSRAT